MTDCFLGVDIGDMKSHALIADESGQALGMGVGGPGNHENRQNFCILFVLWIYVEYNPQCAPHNYSYR